jgi:heme exporter protein CcmD
MGGHGLYVWLAYLATMSVLLINHIWVRRSFRQEVRLAILLDKASKKGVDSNES